MDELNKRINALPQELIDMISDEVFTADSDQVYEIATDYKPPSTLQVSRSTRQKFAQSYYGNGSSFLFQQPATAQTWALSIPAAHRNLICQLKSVVGQDPQRNGLSPAKHISGMVRLAFHLEMEFLENRDGFVVIVRAGDKKGL